MPQTSPMMWTQIILFSLIFFLLTKSMIFKKIKMSEESKKKEIKSKKMKWLT